MLGILRRHAEFFGGIENEVMHLLQKLDSQRSIRGRVQYHRLAALAHPSRRFLFGLSHAVSCA
jgi:hypothetical protein